MNKNNECSTPKTSIGDETPTGMSTPISTGTTGSQSQSESPSIPDENHLFSRVGIANRREVNLDDT